MDTINYYTKCFTIIQFSNGNGNSETLIYSAFLQLFHWYCLNLFFFFVKKPTIILITFNITRMHGMSLKELSGFSFVRATPLQSYPHFNYWYQVTCSSFRVPEQLTPVRVHRMQMSIRPTVCPSSEWERAGPGFIKRCSKAADAYIFVSGNLYPCAEYWVRAADFPMQRRMRDTIPFLLFVWIICTLEL